MKKKNHAFFPCLAVCAFFPCLAVCALLAGCGKQSEEAIAEKLIEKSLSRDGVAAKVDLDGGTMKFSTTDAQGRKADFKVEGDTVQVVSEDGVMTFASGENTKVPQNFPEDVLVYEGAKPVSAMTNPRGFSLSLTTTDALATVGEKYKAAMAAAGWKEKSAFNSEDTWMLVYAKEAREATVMVNKADDGTSILLSVAAQPAAE
jgi:hypothetical protein